MGGTYIKLPELRALHPTQVPKQQVEARNTPSISGDFATRWGGPKATPTRYYPPASAVRFMATL
ncbi:hypothetical protein GCM10027348_30780 [Hymenobacter tenuis]